MRTLADAQFVIAREHGFETWKVFIDRIAELTGRDQKAALFNAAANALIAGNASALERMLRTHEQMFRNERPPATWSVGLAPNEAPGDEPAISDCGTPARRGLRDRRGRRHVQRRLHDSRARRDEHPSEGRRCAAAAT